MKITFSILFTLLFSIGIFSCKSKVNTAKNDTKTIELPATVVVKMQRTPCYGKCPNYVVEIYSNRTVKYEGKMFVDYIGSFESVISEEDLSKIKSKIKEINFFELNSKYDSQATDLPSTIFEITLDKQFKKIINRHKGPEELKTLEKLIEEIVYGSNLKPIKK